MKNEMRGGARLNAGRKKKRTASDLEKGLNASTSKSVSRKLIKPSTAEIVVVTADAAAIVVEPPTDVALTILSQLVKVNEPTE